MKQKLTLALALAAAGCATPEFPKPEFTNITALNTTYMLRGQNLSDGKPVVQDTLVAISGPLSAIAFASHHPDSGRTHEADITLNYDVNVGDRLRLSPNVTYLTFPNLDLRARTELAVKATLDDTYSLNVVRDLDNKEGLRRGTYVELGARKAFEVFGLNPVADIAVGWENHFLSNETGLRHIDAGLSLPIPLKFLGENVTLIPGIRRTESLNDKVANDKWYGGLTLEVKF